jgi:hypothetical protein
VDIGIFAEPVSHQRTLAGDNLNGSPVTPALTGSSVSIQKVRGLSVKSLTIAALLASRVV